MEKRNETATLFRILNGNRKIKATTWYKVPGVGVGPTCCQDTPLS